MLGSVLGALVLWSIFGSNWPAARAFGSNSWDTSVYSAGQVMSSVGSFCTLLFYDIMSYLFCHFESGFLRGNDRHNAADIQRFRDHRHPLW